MKKLFILLSMALVLSTTAFADASDFSISLGVPLQRIDSTVDGVRSIKSETDLTPFMISGIDVCAIILVNRILQNWLNCIGMNTKNYSGR